MAFMTMFFCSAKILAYGFPPSAGGTLISVRIRHAPTLFGVRNLKRRNIRPHPIKLGRICTRRGEIRARYCQLSRHGVETQRHTPHACPSPRRDALHRTQDKPRMTPQALNGHWRESPSLPGSGHLLSPRIFLRRRGLQRFSLRRRRAPGAGR